MIPKMPSFPTGNTPVKSISPDWLRRLWRCVEYAMVHPTGDNKTTVRHGEYLSAKEGNGDAVAGAAAPAAGSAYTGPFAVSYDNELGQFFVAPGWVDAIGTLTLTPRLPILASPDTGAPGLIVYLCFFWDSGNEAIGYELAFRSTGSNAAIDGEAVSSTIEREYVAIAKIQKLADGTDTVTQYQHGPIRISGRAW